MDLAQRSLMRPQSSLSIGNLRASPVIGYLERLEHDQPLLETHHARRVACAELGLHPDGAPVPPTKEGLQCGLQARSPGREAIGDEVPVAAGVARVHQRRTPFAQAEHHDIYLWPGIEVSATEAVHDGGLEPRLEQGSPESPVR